MNNDSPTITTKSRDYHSGSPTCCAEHAQGSASAACSPALSIHTPNSAITQALGSPLLGEATVSHSALINQTLSQSSKEIGGGAQWVEGVEIERLDTQTGEIKTFAIRPDGREVEQVDSKEEKKKKNEARAQRWRLLETAQAILQIMDHRTCGCMRYVQGGDPVVLETQYGCHYGNVMVCGMPWTCPICTTRISERRREEIELVKQRHIEQTGGQLFMLTLTFPHGSEDDLKGMLKRFRKALARFKGSRRMGKLKRLLDVAGVIRALEVTWGRLNGWHPHVHEIWLVGPQFEDVDLEWLQAELLLLWRRACKNSGFQEPDAYHGVAISLGEGVSEYIAKWGMGAELTKAHCKHGRNGRYTPWDLLRWHKDTGEEHPAELFREYAQAFYRAQQLVWSRGLKARYSIWEYTDQELAKRQQEEAVIVVRIPRADWLRVCRFQGRGTVLVLAEKGGAPAVLRYLDDLRMRESVGNQPRGQPP